VIIIKVAVIAIGEAVIVIRSCWPELCWAVIVIVIALIAIIIALIYIWVAVIPKCNC
jgi:hypothetical protein